MILLPQNNPMQYNTLLQKVTPHQHLILPVLFMLTGLLFLSDFWLGWISQAHICPKEETSCSIAVSSAYITDLSASGSTLSSMDLAAQVSLEIGSLMEIIRTTPELAPLSQEMNAFITPLRDQIVAAVSADERLFSLLRNGEISPLDRMYLTMGIRMAVLDQMESFAALRTRAVEEKINKNLAVIIPESITSFDLSKNIEDRTSSYLGTGDRFMLENVQLTGERSDGNIFETISGTMTIQGTLAPLTHFIQDIQSSGDVFAEQTKERTSLPLMRIMQITLTPAGMTTPDATVDTAKTVYRAAITFEAFARAITEEGVTPLIEQKKSLKIRAEELSSGGAVLRAGQTMQKVEQLLTLAANAERTLDAALSQKNYQAAKDQVQSLIELYQTVISSFSAT